LISEETKRLRDSKRQQRAWRAGQIEREEDIERFRECER